MSKGRLSLLERLVTLKIKEVVGLWTIFRAVATPYPQYIPSQTDEFSEKEGIYIEIFLCIEDIFERPMFFIAIWCPNSKLWCWLCSDTKDDNKVNFLVHPQFSWSLVSCPTRLIISASYQQRDWVQQCTTPDPSIFCKFTGRRSSPWTHLLQSSTSSSARARWGEHCEHCEMRSTLAENCCQ